MSGIYSNYFYTNYGDIHTVPDWPYRTDKGPDDTPINVGPSDTPNDFIQPTQPVQYNYNNNYEVLKAFYKQNPEQLKDFETLLGCLSDVTKGRYFRFIDVDQGKRYFRAGPYLEYMQSLFKIESSTLRGYVASPQQLHELAVENKNIYVIDNVEDLLNCSFTAISNVNDITCTYQKHYIALTHDHSTVAWGSKSILEHEFNDIKRDRMYRVFLRKESCMNFLREHSFGYWDIFGFRINLPATFVQKED